MKARTGFILILASLLMAACGSSRSEPELKTPPDGEYRREVTDSTILILRLDQGHFSVSDTKNGQAAEGSYSVDGDKITFIEEATTDVGKSICGSNTTYSYRWKLDEKTNQVDFDADNDPCYEREQAHLSGSFVYKALK